MRDALKYAYSEQFNMRDLMLYVYIKYFDIVYSVVAHYLENDSTSSDNYYHN